MDQMDVFTGLPVPSLHERLCSIRDDLHEQYRRSETALEESAQLLAEIERNRRQMRLPLEASPNEADAALVPPPAFLAARPALSAPG
jgi:hypothetical protein